MKRLYESLLELHFAKHRQMLFLAGPRQVGKTTIAKYAAKLTDRFYYLNWDNTDHRLIIIAGPKNVADYLKLSIASDQLPIVVFDEIHKYSRWKQFLKGFFDTYGELVQIIVTGSSKLDIMGRYLLYRVHPVSIAEYVYPTLPENEIRMPKKLSDEKLNNLMEFGGFPEPLLKADSAFQRQWQRLRFQQTFHEDIRALTHIHEMAQLEMLAELIKNQACQLVNYSSFAEAVNISVPTCKRWITSLSSFYYSFTIQPWHKNVNRSLLKQPKIYLWNWSQVTDKGARLENFVACHLLKAVHFWTDYGLGEFGLYYLRDKEQREVDFLVTKNNKPWFLVEVKSSHKSSLNESLYYFQKHIHAPHAFQVVFDLAFVNKNCFEYTAPIIVPASTLLSQLV